MRALAFLLFLPLAAQAQSCNWACAARKVEVRLLKPGVAERHGDRLVLITKPESVVFDDNKRACDAEVVKDCAAYALIAVAPGSLVVRQFLYEGSNEFLIDVVSGKKTRLTGAPTFSPDGRELVITDFSDEGDNNLEVWRRDGDGAKLEWAHPSKRSFMEDPALLRYPSDSKLALPPVFRVAGWQGARVALAVSTDDQKHHWTGSLTHDAQGWHLSAKSPPDMLKSEQSPTRNAPRAGWSAPPTSGRPN